MITYRIDNRDFNVGDAITPQGLYQNVLDDKRKRVEKILEENRPCEKPPRTEILMLFQSFEDAKIHWTKQRNSKFYKTEIEDVGVFHIGDYQKVEELFVNIDNDIIAERIATEYWNGIFTDNPIVELFVDSAAVIEIKSNNERERHYESMFRRTGQRVPGIRIITE